MEGCAKKDGIDGGVGLGFTMDDLQKWQGEIIQRQRRQQYEQEHFHNHGPCW
jgi:hypothetical protein